MKTAESSQGNQGISLREHIDATIEALDRHLTAEIDALRRETQTSNEAAKHAVEVAAKEARDRLAAHNGLIEQMRQQGAQFASQEGIEEFKKSSQANLADFKETNDTRLRGIERFQAMLMGGLVLVSAIGIANLVKVWSPTTPVIVERPVKELLP